MNPKTETLNEIVAQLKRLEDEERAEIVAQLRRMDDDERAETLGEIVAQLRRMEDEERELDARRLNALRHLQAELIARWLDASLGLRRWNTVPPPIATA